MSTVLVACFQLLILGFETATSVLKHKNTNVLGNGNHSVLWHGMKTPMNFMKRFTSIKILCLAYLKHVNFSENYSVRHAFISID